MAINIPSALARSRQSPGASKTWKKIIRRTTLMARRKRPLLRSAWRLIALPVGKKLTSTARAALLLVARTADTSSSMRQLLVLTKRLHLIGSRRRTYAYHIGKYDYQFSPSSTPLFTWSRSAPRSSKRRMLLFSLCCGSGGERCVAEDMEEIGLEDRLFLEASHEEDEEEEWEEWTEDEEECVDRRAERFIERFYEEMELQRRSAMEGLI